MDLTNFLKGMNRVYGTAEGCCPACEPTTRSKLAESSELTVVGELSDFGCKWHPFFVSVLAGNESGVVFVNSAQARKHLGVGQQEPNEPEKPAKQPYKLIMK